jgi:hypothetical protein
LNNFIHITQFTLPANFNTSFNIAHAQRCSSAGLETAFFFYLFRMFTRWLSFGGRGGGGSNFKAKPSQSQPQGADCWLRHSTLLVFLQHWRNQLQQRKNNRNTVFPY